MRRRVLTAVGPAESRKGGWLRRRFGVIGVLAAVWTAPLAADDGGPGCGPGGCPDPQLRHVMFAFVDHFEPLPYDQANGQVDMWVDDYMAMASGHTDADGRHPIHSYFQYFTNSATEGYIAACLARLNKAAYYGYGEVDYHLHHGVADERTRTEQEATVDLINLLARTMAWFNQRGCLVTAEAAPQQAFAFIHGLWALDNSRLDDWTNPGDPHREYCGVNGELSILRSWGCYADFTFPTAPPMTPLVTDSIFYVQDDPLPASYEEPGNIFFVAVNQPPVGDLMIVEGPGPATNIDEGDLPSLARMDGWVGHNVHVEGRDDWVFVKVYTHGCEARQDLAFTPSTAVAAGATHSLAVRSGGAIAASTNTVTWGSNSWGQCEAPYPNEYFVAVAAGAYHSLGLKANGSIVAWGDNRRGQCSVPWPNTGFVAIAAGYAHNLGLKADGSIVAWGDNTKGQCNVPQPNTGYTAIAAGGYDHNGFSLAIRGSDGSVVSWGNYTSVPPYNSGFSKVAAGWNHSLALKGSDGSVAAWGYNPDGRCTVPSPNSGFTDIAAGGYHSVGLKSDGVLVAWGSNSDGRCTVPAPNADFVAVAAGGYHSVGLKSDGSIVAWGRNTSNQCRASSVWSAFFGATMDQFYSAVEAKYNDGVSWKLHYVSAREMYNIIKAAEAGLTGDPGQYRDYTVPRYANMLVSTERKYHLLSYTPQEAVLESLESGGTMEFSLKEFGACGAVEESGDQVVWTASDSLKSKGVFGELRVIDPTPSWYYRVTGIACPRGDFNHDGLVDLSDYAFLPDCLTGPTGAAPRGDCQEFDTDGDNEVDLQDFAKFQRELSGL